MANRTPQMTPIALATRRSAYGDAGSCRCCAMAGSSLRKPRRFAGHSASRKTAANAAGRPGPASGARPGVRQAGRHRPPRIAVSHPLRIRPWRCWLCIRWPRRSAWLRAAAGRGLRRAREPRKWLRRSRAPAGCAHPRRSNVSDHPLRSACRYARAVPGCSSPALRLSTIQPAVADGAAGSE